MVKSIRSEIRLTNNYLKPLCPLPSVQPFTPGLHTKAVTFTILPVTLVKTATEIKKILSKKYLFLSPVVFRGKQNCFYINFNGVFSTSQIICNFKFFVSNTNYFVHDKVRDNQMPRTVFNNL